MTVLCVLRSGGVYTPEWVQRLRSQVAEHAPGARFACISDVNVPGVECLRLEHEWPGWWAKMEALRHFPDRVLYLDLDTDVVGPLDWLDYTGDLALLSDFYRPHLAQSGVMAWGHSDYTATLYEVFAADADAWMQQYRGDGEWLHAHAMADRLQDLYPGRIVSHKVHCGDGVPEGASIVCYHGEPKRYPDGVIR